MYKYRLKMTLSMHDIEPDKLFSKDIKEFQYVVKRDDQAMIAVAKSLKTALNLYKTNKGIGTLAEAVWRACVPGIRSRVCVYLIDSIFVKRA